MDAGDSYRNMEESRPLFRRLESGKWRHALGMGEKGSDLQNKLEHEGAAPGRLQRSKNVPYLGLVGVDGAFPGAFFSSLDRINWAMTS